MQVRTGVGVLFVAQFTESKVGKTGLTVTVNVYLVNTSGSASTVVTGGSATEVGKGVYSYLLASGSNTTAGVLIATFLTSTTSVDQQEIPAAWGIELPAPCTVTSIIDDAITANAVAAGAITASEAPALADIAPIRAKTDNLPADPADASDIAGSFGSIASTLATISGYIDTEVAAIKAKTDNLPAAPAGTGDVPSASAIATAVLSATVEGTLDLGEVLRVVLAACAGKADGLAGTTAHYRDQADTKNRITATVDEHGNRTAITLDPT